MSKAATLRKRSDGKFEATYNGEPVASSFDMFYVITMIKSGRCNKANRLGVTDVIIPPDLDMNRAANPQGKNPEIVGAVQEATQIATQVDRFSINQRFDFLTQFTTMVAEREAPSLIVSGDGGLGKTWTIMDTLHSLGIYNCDDLPNGELPPGPCGDGRNGTLKYEESQKYYKVVKGYSTAKGVYRTLYENRHKIVIFDDCDNALRDPTAVNLLKAGLDSYDKRVISWNAESLRDDGLPSSFMFKGGVIFITNMPLYKLDKAMRTRAIPVDLSMTMDQKIERMALIVRSEKFLPNYSDEDKEKALGLITKLKDDLPEISFRSLITTTRIASRGGEWEGPAEYALRQGF